MAPTTANSAPTGRRGRKSGGTKSSRSGLTLPVSRVHAQMKLAGGHKRVSDVSGLYAAAAVEFILTQLLGKAQECATKAKVKRVGARQLQAALKANGSLGAQFADFPFTALETLGRATEVILTKDALRARREAQSERKKSKAAATVATAATAATASA
jgi:histone H2A